MTAVPHWAVILVAVPALWLLVAGAVLGAERVLVRFEGGAGRASE